MKLYMIRTVPLSIIRSSSTVHSAMVYVIPLLSVQLRVPPFEKDQDGTEFHPGPARKLSTNLYDIYHCRVYSE